MGLGHDTQKPLSVMQLKKKRNFIKKTTAQFDPSSMAFYNSGTLARKRPAVSVEAGVSRAAKLPARSQAHHPVW